MYFKPYLHKKFASYKNFLMSLSQSRLITTGLFLLLTLFASATRNMKLCTTFSYLDTPIIKIIERPISYTDERKELGLSYLKERYGIEEAIILESAFPSAARKALIMAPRTCPASRKRSSVFIGWTFTLRCWRAQLKPGASSFSPTPAWSKSNKTKPTKR